MSEFSVLIPVYNAAPYLERSVTSVLKQTFPDFEIILIDDGSTDESWAVMKSLAERDPRIRIKRNEVNSGTFVTRGRLVRESVGTYVTFVDADDEIAPAFLEEAKKILARERFDIIEFGFRCHPDHAFKHSYHLKPDQWALRGNTVFEEYFTHPAFFSTAWGRIYDGKLLRSQEFPEIRLPHHEDYIFFIILLYHATSYYFSRKPLYIYHFGIGCCGRNHFTLENYKQNCSSIQRALAFMDSFFKKNPISEKAKLSYQNFKTSSYHVLLDIILQNKIDEADKSAAFDALIQTFGSQELLKLLQQSTLLNDYTPVTTAVKGLLTFILKVVVRWRKRIMGLFK